MGVAIRRYLVEERDPSPPPQLCLSEESFFLEEKSGGSCIGKEMIWTLKKEIHSGSQPQEQVQARGTDGVNGPGGESLEAEQDSAE